MTPITVRRIAREEARACAEPLADVLLDCVEGGASVSFLWPLARDKAVAFWRRVAEGVEQDERVLLVAQDARGALVGTVQLLLDLPENQPHRADVAKMLVMRRARRQGVAQALLEALDREAIREQRSVLVLDTVTGGDAERLYLRNGWTRVGSVPHFALMPDGRPCATTYFYKQLPT
jgi:GNAT superfamily N-acetyltransferase